MLLILKKKLTIFTAFLALVLGWLGVTAEAWAESREEKVRRINAGTVGIISGGYGGTYLRIAADLATVLDDGDRLRVLPIVGKGSFQNVEDLLYLKGIDLAIVQSDVLTRFRKERPEANVDTLINYIAKLFNEEFHLVAGKNIRSIKDLAGKKVSFGLKGGGTFITASAVFETLGIKVEPVFLDPALSFELVRKGEIAAAAYVTGKPAGAIAALSRKAGFRLLAIPYAKKLRATYLPAFFTHGDYPNLVPKGVNVPSISVGTIMTVYNWKPGTVRYRKVVRFIEAFFRKYQELKKPPRHRKWRELNLASTVPGWRRYPPAKLMLQRLLAGRTGGASTGAAGTADRNTAAVPRPQGRAEVSAAEKKTNTVP